MQNYVMHLPCTPQFTGLLGHLTVQDNSQVAWTEVVTFRNYCRAVEMQDAMIKED